MCIFPEEDQNLQFFLKTCQLLNKIMDFSIKSLWKWFLTWKYLAAEASKRIIFRLSRLVMPSQALEASLFKGSRTRNSKGINDILPEIFVDYSREEKLVQASVRALCSRIDSFEHISLDCSRQNKYLVVVPFLRCRTHFSGKKRDVNSCRNSLVAQLTFTVKYFDTTEKRGTSLRSMGLLNRLKLARNA